MEQVLRTLPNIDFDVFESLIIILNEWFEELLGGNRD